MYNMASGSQQGINTKHGKNIHTHLQELTPAELLLRKAARAAATLPCTMWPCHSAACACWSCPLGPCRCWPSQVGKSSDMCS